MNSEVRGFLEKHDLLGCIQCGRCTGGCPVAARTDLNVRRVIYESIDEKMLDKISKLPHIWDCTTCSTCAVRCPKGLKPLEVLIGLREVLVESGMVQSTVRDALESVFQEGNPWKKPRATRLDWAEGLEVKIAVPGEKVENLIFICCTVAYDPKLQDIARNLVKVLNKAEVDYGLVGDSEMCCSSEVYSLGEAGLFEMMVEDNTKLLNSFAVNRMVTISPHCYSTFKNQHPLLKMESVHYTQLLSKLLAEGKLELTKGVNRKVVFHDPCYLGKKNSVFEEPRFILKQVPGMEILEFARKRERSLCCEGGGGKMWVETESLKERLAENRIKDARALGADVLAVACPFCILTLDDALKAKGLEEEMKVVDILEILNEAVG